MAVLTIRFKHPGAYQRLKRGAAQRAELISSAGERLIDEGLRMEAHPGIVFRDGPSGRRAGLAAGPDVWEVVGLLRGLRGSVEKRVDAVAAKECPDLIGLADEDLLLAATADGNGPGRGSSP